MTNADKSNEGQVRRRQRLADALGINGHFQHFWSDADLGAMYRHQMDASVVVDLSVLDPAASSRLALLSESKGLLLKSFGDLLRHPSPPLELLKLAKDFAKANRGNAASSIPDAVATVLYFASIAAALVRCSARITSLADWDLAVGFKWSVEQNWVDADMKRLFTDASQALKNIAGA